MALVTASQRPFSRLRPEPARVVEHGMLDLRVPLSHSELLRPVGQAIAVELADAGIGQVVGRGFGAYALVGAIAALGDFRCGFIREQPKSHFGQLIEGDLDSSAPIVVIDDLLASGRSAAISVHRLRLEGFKPIGVRALFRFGWSRQPRLVGLGVDVDALGTLERARASTGAELASARQAR